MMSTTPSATTPDIKEFIISNKNRLVKELGNVPLMEDTINEVGKKMFGSEWNPVSNQRTFKPLVGYHIINTSYSPRSPGVHWIAAYCTRNGAIHVFDSFARNENHLVPIIAKFGIDSPTKGYHMFQRSGNLCGHISLSWLLAVKQFGIRRVAHV